MRYGKKSLKVGPPFRLIRNYRKKNRANSHSSVDPKIDSNGYVVCVITDQKVIETFVCELDVFCSWLDVKLSALGLT